MKAPRLLLREHVKEVVLARILSGEYEPGERLVETRLAREFETSQVPVREALRELEILRFVESEPFRGARVRAVSRDEIAEIFPVRSAIEEVAVRLATVRLDGDVEELKRHLACDGEGRRRPEIDTSRCCSDVEFHRTIVDACGNSILHDVWQSLRVEGRTMITSLQARDRSRGDRGDPRADPRRDAMRRIRTLRRRRCASISMSFVHLLDEETQ